MTGFAGGAAGQQNRASASAFPPPASTTAGVSAPPTGVAESQHPTEFDYPYRAKAIYSYEANPDDSNEVAFSKHEILEVSDVSGRWWQAKKENGEKGIIPSNYVRVPFCSLHPNLLTISPRLSSYKIWRLVRTTVENHHLFTGKPPQKALSFFKTLSTSRHCTLPLFFYHGIMETKFLQARRLGYPPLPPRNWTRCFLVCLFVPFFLLQLLSCPNIGRDDECGRSSTSSPAIFLYFFASTRPFWFCLFCVQNAALRYPRETKKQRKMKIILIGVTRASFT